MKITGKMSTFGGPDAPVELPPWSPPPRVVVDLTIPDGVYLVLRINGDQLIPEEPG